MVQQRQPAVADCGWIGVQVSPMTAAFAGSLGMAEPYGGIFGKPEPGSPAADAGIAKGDVITAINGAPLMRSSDFATAISEMAPNSLINLTTYRNGALMQIRLMLGSSKCASEGHGRSAAATVAI